MKNFRDFAYANMQKRKIFRSEALTKITKKDQKVLKNKNIKTIVDLRFKQEVNEANDKKIPGINYINLPLVTLESIKEEIMLIKQKHQEEQLDASIYYRIFVSSKRSDAWAKIFDLLLQNDDSGILFHCSSGKDRTGIVSAIILTALGIDKETIYYDYLLTNKHPIIPLKYRIRALFLKKDAKKEMMDNFIIKKEYLDTAYEQIDSEYASFDNFLEDCCKVDCEKRTKLKNKYLIKQL